MSTPTYMDNLRKMAQALAQGLTAKPRHHEFNEEEESDGPDPYRELVETELEMERRAEIEEERRNG